MERRYSELDVHASRGAPDFDFLITAIGREFNGDGSTNDPAAWSDWLECLFAADGIRWSPPQTADRLWGEHAVTLRNGVETIVRLSRYGNSEWLDNVPAGPENGMTEEEALEHFDALLMTFAMEDKRDLQLVRDDLARRIASQSES